MMAKGLSLEEIEKQFNMDEYKGWDRDSHYPWMAETIWRELQSMPPQIVPITEQTVKGTIAKIAEEGRFLTTTSDAGEEISPAHRRRHGVRRCPRSFAAQGRHEIFRAVHDPAGRQRGARLRRDGIRRHALSSN